MTEQEKQTIHEMIRKVLCKTRTLPLATEIFVSISMQQFWDAIKAMPTDEELNERIKIINKKIEQVEKKEIAIVEPEKFLTIPATMIMRGTSDDVDDSYVCVSMDDKEVFKKQMLEKFKDGDKVLVYIIRKELSE